MKICVSLQNSFFGLMVRWDVSVKFFLGNSNNAIGLENFMSDVHFVF